MTFSALDNSKLAYRKDLNEKDHHVFASSSVQSLKEVEYFLLAEEHEGNSQELNAGFLAKQGFRVATLAAEVMSLRESYKEGDREYALTEQFYHLNKTRTKWDVTGWDEIGYRDRVFKAGQLQEQIENLNEMIRLPGRKRKQSSSESQTGKSLKNQRDAAVAELEKLKIGDVAFPSRTQAMVDTVRYLKDKTEPKVFIAGLTHLKTPRWREEDPRFCLTSLYEELNKHKSAILVPKVFDEHFDRPFSLDTLRIVQPSSSRSSFQDVPLPPLSDKEEPKTLNEKPPSADLASIDHLKTLSHKKHKSLLAPKRLFDEHFERSFSVDTSPTVLLSSSRSSFRALPLPSLPDEPELNAFLDAPQSTELQSDLNFPAEWCWDTPFPGSPILSFDPDGDLIPLNNPAPIGAMNLTLSLNSEDGVQN